MSAKPQEFTKKVLGEAINKAKKQGDIFDCPKLELFSSYHDVNLSDMAGWIEELREEGVIDSQYGLDLRCIER